MWDVINHRKRLLLATYATWEEAVIHSNQHPHWRISPTSVRDHYQPPLVSMSTAAQASPEGDLAVTPDYVETEAEASAPLVAAPQNNAERDPSVMADCGGADAEAICMVDLSGAPGLIAALLGHLPDVPNARSFTPSSPPK